VDVSDIPVMIIVGHVEGRRAARGSDVATRGGGGATQSHILSTGHPDGAPVWLEEDATTVTKLLTVRLITKGLRIIFCLCVCLLLQDLVQSCLHGGGGYGRTCATRDDEPRPV
jgi:hypothetical protein